MPFTQQQKRRLMLAYEPILLLEERERFVPISPAAYIERAALWSNSDPAAHRKELWGKPQLESQALPRQPEVGPGGITVNPFEAGDDKFLGAVAIGDKFFLENWGWDEPGEEAALATDTPDRGRVSEQTLNRGRSHATSCRRLGSERRRGQCT